ncbi:MAG TPA: CPXCG motif-containing cysteine-rich protein [Thiotrichales bacterium]|nr:CPXCG motif-containing cysteine-rich protein [Thiotrichales bacterium]
MHPTSEERVFCPYCGEPFTLLLDVTDGEYESVEDCAVCCKPVTVRVWRTGEEEPSLEVLREDE